MATSPSATSLQQLRDLFEGGTVAGLGDGELLARYAASHDGPAFEALVARHGPMVVATCRAILKHDHDVEDAFQVTFLVLARRARSVHRRWHAGGLAAPGGLSGRGPVAGQYPAATPAQVGANGDEHPGPARPVLDFDLCSILHAEIDRLSEAERLPVVRATCRA